MKRTGVRRRIALVVLAALLALPLAPAAFPVGAKNRARTVTKTFGNGGELTVPALSSVDYPSTIAVAGLKGTIRDVNLTINRLGHTHPDEIQMLLVGPRGQTAIVLANVGGGDDLGGPDGVTLMLDDEARQPLPDQTALLSGTFRPTNAGGLAIAFTPPAPPVTRANAALSVFDGTNANGTWRLFIQDKVGPADGGEVGSGWALEITTQAKPKKKR